MTDPRSQRLDALIKQAPKTLSPQQSLWEHIELRIDAPFTEPTTRGTGYQPILAIACSLLLMILLSYTLNQRDIAPQKTSIAISEYVEAGSHELLTLIMKIEAEHQQTIEALQNNAYAVNWHQSPYSLPVENGLEELRHAAQQILEHLKASPADKQLWQLWLWVQQREIALLQQGQTLAKPDTIQQI